MGEISKFVGEYAETGCWRDSQGHAGVLGGRSVIRLDDDQWSLSSDDGHRMVARASRDAVQPLPVEGSGGGSVSSGLLYVGDESFVLDYTADVRGRQERTVDVWVWTGAGVRRAGIIRQIETTIWFEALMARIG